MITGKDILDAGYPPGPHIGRMLEAAAELEKRGVTDPKYALKLLRRDFPIPKPKPGLRNQPAPFSEAIAPETEGERENVEKVRGHMRELLRNPIISRGAIMPDACPAGQTLGTIPVGGAIAVENAIIPAAHSADICCSMFASFYQSGTDIGDQLDALVGSTRFGPGGRDRNDLVHHPVLDEDSMWSNRFLRGLQEKATVHMADQGDGNHFAYIGEMEAGLPFRSHLIEAGYPELADKLVPQVEAEEVTWKVLVTHHGSRGLGSALYKRGHEAAIKATAKLIDPVPKASAWLDYTTDQGRDYWDALQYVGRWTKANHQSIHSRFLKNLGTKAAAQFGNEHNFVWRRGGSTFLHGKGATPAWRDPDSDNPLLGLIPLNMSEPILMVLGKDNPDFLSFAPHGAGRNMSRSALLRPYRNKKTWRLDEEKVARVVAAQTEGLDIRWFLGKPDLSESPVAYKNADAVRAQIEQFGLAEVIAAIRPLGCIMAGDSGPKPWEKPQTPKQKRQIQHRANRRKTRQQLGHWEDGEA